MDRRKFTQVLGLGTLTLWADRGRTVIGAPRVRRKEKLTETNYDPQMALTLARAVSEAYRKYNDSTYTIHLGQYEIKDSIYVFESSEAGYIFFGFTASGSFSGSPPFNNLVVLRGTQSDEEALGDLNWESTECLLPSRGGQTYGRVSKGIYSFYTGADLGLVTSLEDSIKSAIKGLDDSLPEWYIAGHSLGGAVATFAALDAVVNKSYGDGSVLPKLYTYGSMLVGKEDFRSAFSASGISEAFRVANLADWVPTFTGIEADTPGFVHVGLECSYLWQTGGAWANHTLDNTYLAVVRDHPEVINFGPRQYPQ